MQLKKHWILLIFLDPCVFFLFWQVKWQPVPDGKFKEPTIDYSAAVSATTQEQQKCQCEKIKYVILVFIKLSQ